MSSDVQLMKPFDFADYVDNYDYIPIGTLANHCALSPIEFYGDIKKDVYKVIENFCNMFGIKKEYLKVGRRYKKVPKKYYGIFYHCFRQICREEIENDKPSLLYYLKTETAYMNLGELKEANMIKYFVESLEDYYNTCIAEKSQILFTAHWQDENLTITTKFDCMRYKENDKYCEILYLNRDEDSRLIQIINLNFSSITEFRKFLDNPFNDEDLHKGLFKGCNYDGEFTELWNNFTKEVMSRDDFPKYEQYPECFCEKEFKIIIEGLTHGRALNMFYDEVDKNYFSTWERLQAIVDMSYVLNLCSDEEILMGEENVEYRKIAYQKWSKIVKLINEEYFNLVNLFIPFFDNFMDYTNAKKFKEDDDGFIKFKKTYARWIVLDALYEDKELCNRINKGKNDKEKIIFNPYLKKINSKNDKKKSSKTNKKKA